MNRIEFPDADGRCLNCGTRADAAYCPACGQKRARRLDARTVLGSGWEQLVDLDFPVVRTLQGLLLRPGVVLRDYLAGRRQPYTPPLRFFLLLATISVAATFLFGLDRDLTHADAGSSPGAEALGSAIARFVLAARPYLAPLILLPLSGLLVRLWRRSGIGFAEAYAVLLYGFAIATLVHVPAAALGAWLVPGHAAALRLALLALVLGVQLHALFGGPLRGTLWRLLVLVLAYIPLATLVVLPVYALATWLGLAAGAG